MLLGCWLQGALVLGKCFELYAYTHSKFVHLSVCMLHFDKKTFVNNFREEWVCLLVPCSKCRGRLLNFFQRALSMCCLNV